MTPRLRRLDALFAEKVLGWPDWKVETTNAPPYTRSLDAAWEGVVERIGWGETRGPFSGRPTEKAYDATVGDMAAESGPLFSAEAAHPAEALVIACLRAVGVTEEEMS